MHGLRKWSKQGCKYPLSAPSSRCFFCVLPFSSLSLDLRKLHPCLNQCSDLWDLDLSSNSLTSSSLGALDGSKLGKLKNLNLSSNRLESLGSLPVLLGLESLRLESNDLRELQGPAGLAQTLKTKAPNLRALWIRNLKGDKTNPGEATTQQTASKNRANTQHARETAARVEEALTFLLCLSACSPRF